jgi:hypothetical protein
MSKHIEPSDRAIKNICDAKKFCKAQGKITFGQLKSLVTNSKVKKILTDVGEGSYKATIRILPWFFPQLILAGFTGSVLRAFNKIFRPAMEDTTGYKTWWGKTISNLLNLVEGDLNIKNPLSKIFFISDGLLTMLDDREKIKFARHIANVASEKPDDEEVPEFFVENELRNWLNEKFLLDPPLQQKWQLDKIEDNEDLPFDEITEGNLKKRTFNRNINKEELKWHFDEEHRKVKVIKANGWGFQLENKLPKKLNDGDTFYIPKNMYHRVIKGSGDLVVEIEELNKNKLILEMSKYRLRSTIRRIVRDIIQVFKENDEGEFYLPEYFDDDDLLYDVPELNTTTSVELIIEINRDIRDFRLNAEYYPDDDAISVLIQYNPKNKRVSMYELVGNLNETISHELRHLTQNTLGTQDSDNNDDVSPYEYYTREEELDAQLVGFKRLAKLTKKPVEDIAKNWFDKNKDIHSLTDDEVVDVISKVLNYKR